MQRSSYQETGLLVESELLGGICYEKSSQNQPHIIDHAFIDDLFVVMLI
jgi:hypothetical protein